MAGPNNQHVKAAYAAQYLGTATAATGISVVANGGMGFVNVAAYEMAGNDRGMAGANNLNLTYIRVASTMNFGDWASGFRYPELRRQEHGDLRRWRAYG